MFQPLPYISGSEHPGLHFVFEFLKKYIKKYFEKRSSSSSSSILLSSLALYSYKNPAAASKAGTVLDPVMSTFKNNREYI